MSEGLMPGVSARWGELVFGGVVCVWGGIIWRLTAKYVTEFCGTSVAHQHSDTYCMCDLYVSGQKRYRDSHSTRTSRAHARQSSHKLNWAPNHDLGWAEATSQLHDSRQVYLRPDFVSFCKTDHILATNG